MSTLNLVARSWRYGRKSTLVDVHDDDEKVQLNMIIKLASLGINGCGVIVGSLLTTVIQFLRVGI